MIWKACVLLLGAALLAALPFGCCETCDEEGDSPTDLVLAINAAPDTRITSGPEGTVTSGDVFFTWTGSDFQDEPEELVFAWRLDPRDSDWSAFGPSTQVELSGLADGTYTFRVKARNTGGYEDPVPDQQTFTVDTSGGGDSTPPETEITDGPSGTVNTGDVYFEWTGTDDTDVTDELLYSFRMDEGDWSEFIGETSQDFTGLADGEHTFAVRARDTSGNVDPSPATRTFVVDTGGGGDTTPPDTQITSGPSGTVETGDVTFTFAGTDDTDPPSALVYAWRMDGGSWSSYSGDTQADFTGLADGEHTFAVRARDTSGNVDSSPATRTFIVDAGGGDDTTPPDTQITSGPSGTVDTGDVTFTFTGTDNVDPPAALVYAWRMDGGSWSSYSGDTEASFTGLADGEHTFAVRARDTSGNVDPTPATRTFVVETGSAGGIEMNFPSTSATGNPGEMVVIFGTVTNTMDAGADFHFWIVPNLPAGWVGSFCVAGVCVFEEITVFIEAGATEDMEVNFAIAADATSGDTGVIEQYVEMVVNPGINDHLTFTVTAN